MTPRIPELPQALRLPLFGLLFCLALVSSLTTWAIWQAKGRYQTLTQTQSLLQKNVQALKEFRSDQEITERTRPVLAQLIDRHVDSELDALLAALPDTAQVDALAAEILPQTPWQENRLRLRATFAHEGRLFDLLHAWRQRSAMQHTVGKCRITRHTQALLADCELSYWTFEKGSRP